MWREKERRKKVCVCVREGGRLMKVKLSREVYFGGEGGAKEEAG